MKPYISFLLINCACLVFVMPVHSQPDTSSVNAMYRSAGSEVDKLNYKEARAICDDLLNSLTGKDSFSLAIRIKVLYLQALMLTDENLHQKALDAYAEALRLAQEYFSPTSTELALAYYHIALIYYQAFQLESWKEFLDSAAIYFSKAFSPDDCWNGRIWQHRASMNFFNFGSPDTTLAYLRTATKIYDRCPGDASKNEFDLNHIYYDVFLSLRQFDSAEYYLKKQIDYVSTRHGPMWDFQRGWMELTKAHLYRLNGQYEKAIDHYQFAKSLLLQADTDTLHLISCELYIGTCLNGLGKFDEAYSHFADLTLRAKQYSKISYDYAGLINEAIAFTFAGTGKCDSAIIYAEKSLRSFTIVLHPDNPKLLNLHFVMGSCLLKQQRLAEADVALTFAYDVAVKNFGEDHPLSVKLILEHTAVRIRSGDFETAEKNLDAISKLQVLQHYPEFAYLHVLRSAELMAAKIKDAKNITTSSPELIKLLYTAMEKFRAVRNQFVSEEARARTVNTSIAGLHHFIPILDGLYKTNPDPSLYEVMLQLSETHRGLLLSEAMGQSAAHQLAGIPVDLQNKERILKSNLAQIKKQIEQEYTRSMPKKEYIKGLQASQIKTQAEFDELIETFQLQYPEYYHAKFAHTNISLQELQKRLSADEVIAEYLVVDNDIYIFVITSSQTKVFKAGDGNMLLKKATEFIRLSSSPSPDENRVKRIELLAGDLYKGLIKPFDNILTSTSSLIIIPDRSLYYFPFELLRMGNSEEKFKDYLIYKYPVQYQSSLLLWMDQEQNKHDAVNRMLTVSPTFEMNPGDIASRKGLAFLDYAENESAAIHQSWGGKWLTKDKASKSNFVRLASHSDMIHLATHASADDRSGLFSWLAFSPSTHDSLLYLDEIYGLTLDARMVVLSGCETGIGPLQTGEGLISLSRAFSYAGAESIITSLWPVHDEATSIIMTSFYKHLKEGKPKDKALQLAKLEYLENIKDPAQADPYYWAGFIAMGDMSPLTISNGLEWWIPVVLLLIGIGVVWGIRRVKQQRV